ncbi:MAG: peptidase M42, partial [Chloroflexota bacterium]
MPLKIDTAAAVNFLLDLLAIDSPTGMTDRAVTFCDAAFSALGLPGLTTAHTLKGALIVNVPGAATNHPVGLTAHTDTLGLMVKEIKSNGRLKCTNLGGIVWNGVETEGVTVYPSGGDPIRGTIQLVNDSVHINRAI